MARSSSWSCNLQGIQATNKRCFCLFFKRYYTNSQHLNWSSAEVIKRWACYLNFTNAKLSLRNIIIDVLQPINNFWSKIVLIAVAFFVLVKIVLIHPIFCFNGSMIIKIGFIMAPNQTIAEQYKNSSTTLLSSVLHLYNTFGKNTFSEYSTQDAMTCPCI